MRVHCSLGKRQHKRFVHGMVLEAFVGPRPHDLQCRHLDGDSLNNELSNLRWGTALENIGEDRRRHGRIPRGVDTPRARLDEDWVRCVRTLRKYGWRVSEIAREAGVSKQTIHGIFSGRTWSWVI